MEQPQSVEIVLFIAILCILGVFLWMFVLIFIRRKNKLIAVQQAAKLEFEQELVKTQLEIQEHTLRNISWELHDNIGQLLTLAKIQAQNAQEDPAKVDLAVDSIGTALSELRTLSKHINPNKLQALSLTEAIGREIDRFNRLGVLEAQISVLGSAVRFSQEVELLLFRILQEFMTNTVKYAKASSLNLTVEFWPERIQIKAEENGIGFDLKRQTDGLGLQNMKHRAALIGAELTLESTIGKGSSLCLNYSKNTL